MTEPQSMHDYLMEHISKTPAYLLALELEEINKVKLMDDVIVECKELRNYYLQRQGYIIEHLQEMFGKDSEI
jgi:hypothetical protein